LLAPAVQWGFVELEPEEAGARPSWRRAAKAVPDRYFHLSSCRSSILANLASISVASLFPVSGLEVFWSHLAPDASLTPDDPAVVGQFHDDPVVAAVSDEPASDMSVASRVEKSSGDIVYSLPSAVPVC